MSYTARDLSPLVRGDDWNIKLTLTSSAGALNVQGNTYWFTLKDNADEADPGDLQVSILAPVDVDSSNGIVYIAASKTLTGTLTPKTYNYDVQQVDGSGNVQTLLIGKVKVVKDITRSIS